MTYDLQCQRGLYKNKRGRWCLRGKELRSGSRFEIYVERSWITVMIEFDEEGYFVLPACIRLHHGLNARFIGEYAE